MPLVPASCCQDLSSDTNVLLSQTADASADSPFHDHLMEPSSIDALATLPRMSSLALPLSGMGALALALLKIRL